MKFVTITQQDKIERMVTKRLSLKSKIIKNLMIIYGFGILIGLFILSMILYLYSQKKQSLLQAFSEVLIISTALYIASYYLRGLFPFFIEFNYEIYLTILFGKLGSILYIYFGILSICFELARFYAARRLFKVEQTRNVKLFFTVIWIVISGFGAFYWMNFTYLLTNQRTYEFIMMLFLLVAWNAMLSYTIIQAQIATKFVLLGALTYYFLQITVFALLRGHSYDIFIPTLFVITFLQFGLISIHLLSRIVEARKALNSNVPQ